MYQLPNPMVLGFKAHPFQRHVLSCHSRGDNWTVHVEVQFIFGLPDEKPNHYKVMRYDDGDPGLELIDTAEYERRYQLVLQNEGREKADKWWDDNADIGIVGRNDYTKEWEIAQEMIRRWEAMIGLGLFQPSTTA